MDQQTTATGAVERGSTTWTPGPWEEQGILPGISIRYEVVEVGPRPYVAMRGKVTVAYVRPGADARLIAAAPDLYAALQRIADLKDEAYETEPVSREVADLVARNAGRIARAALARARGEAVTA